MPLIADYHTHTVYSHGKGSVEENVKAALKCGLQSVAISEHYSAHMFYGVRGNKMIKLRKEVDAMNERYGDKIKVLLGVEGNLLGDGISDLPTGEHFFDLMLLGYHRGVFPRDSRSLKWTLGMGKTPKENAMAMIHVIEKVKGIKAMTHPGEYIPMDIPLLARGLADHGVAFELNSSHKSLTLELIEEAKQEKNLTFLLGSDAHCPERVGEIKSALEIAKKANILHRIENYA